MLVLGIDPGTAICGYGLVEAEGSRLRPIHYGAVLTDKSLSDQARLAIIYDELTELVKKYKPEAMAVEQLFFNKNVTTAITVGQARGVILLVAAHQNLKLVEFTPLQVKQAVTGYGRCEKEQVTFMVQKLLSIKEKPRPDDVSDALAVAICAAHSIPAMDRRQL